MWEDPIVEEVHAVRRRIARDCDYDMARIMDLLRKREAEQAGLPEQEAALPQSAPRGGRSRQRAAK